MLCSALRKFFLQICTGIPKPNSDAARNLIFQELTSNMKLLVGSDMVGYWLRMNSPMQYLPGGTFRCAGHLLQFPMATPPLRFLVSDCEGPTSCRCWLRQGMISQVPKSWVVEPLERTIVFPNQIHRWNSFKYFSPCFLLPPPALGEYECLGSPAVRRETARAEDLKRLEGNGRLKAVLSGM